MKNWKLWAISLWLYIWFKPYYKKEVIKDLDEDGEYEYTKHKWYKKKRAISWLLLFPFISPIIFIFGSLKGFYDYFVFVFTYYESWIEAKENISFKSKLDIVRIL